MKKSLLILVIVSVIAFIGNAQNTNENGQTCTSCYETVSTGSYSSALGNNTSATGDNSLAGGYKSKAQGNNSFAFGSQDTAYKENSIALGFQCFANGISSFASGYKSKALADYSTAMGTGALSNGQFGISIGYKTSANGSHSFALGKNVKSKNLYSFIIGTAPVNDSLVNDIQNSLKIGFGSTKHTFFISNSSAMDKTGKVGIGDISYPQAKLHIKADNNEDASIKLETTYSAHFAKIYFDDDYLIFSKSSSPLTFRSVNTQSFFFDNGSVGIGTANPQAKLQVTDGDIFIEDINRGIIIKSPDGQCWRGTVDNNGSLQFTSIDCNTLTAVGQNNFENKMNVKVYPNPSSGALNIKIESDFKSLFIQIFDMSGNTIYSNDIKTQEFLIITKDFPAGNYVVKLTNESGKTVYSEKIVII